MAFASLLAAALCWTPPARPPTFTRRELGSLAGLAAASSGGVLLPASAGGIPPQPYEKQPGFKLNTGQAFPTASFGLQVYDDATAQKLTSLALEVRNLTTRLSYAPWPHPVASPPQLPQPHPYPCRSVTATSSPPCSPRTRSASHAPSRRVAPPPSEPTSPAARPEIPRHACWPRSEAQAPPELPRSPRSVRAPWRRTRLQLPTLVAVPERASAPAALQRHLGQRHPLASRRRARGPLHLRLGPIQPREWKGGCTRSLRARMPREHGSLVRHTPELQPQASKQGPRQLCHSHA